MSAFWNEINSPEVTVGRVTVQPNRYSDDPVMIEIEPKDRNDVTVQEWLSPLQARMLAAALLQAAKAAEKAGRIKSPPPGERS